MREFTLLVITGVKDFLWVEISTLANANLVNVLSKGFSRRKGFSRCEAHKHRLDRRSEILCMYTLIFWVLSQHLFSVKFTLIWCKTLFTPKRC